MFFLIIINMSTDRLPPPLQNPMEPIEIDQIALSKAKTKTTKTKDDYQLKTLWIYDSFRASSELLLLARRLLRACFELLSRINGRWVGRVRFEFFCAGRSASCLLLCWPFCRCDDSLEDSRSPCSGEFAKLGAQLLVGASRSLAAQCRPTNKKKPTWKPSKCRKNTKSLKFYLPLLGKKFH